MAAGTLTSVGQSNTYVKDFASSGRLQIEFSRSVESFALNRYIQIRPVKKDRGYYLRIDQRNCSRIVGGNIDEFVWPDGHDRPKLNNNGQEFLFEDYATIRRNFGEPIGQKAKEQADWDVAGTLERMLAQKAMTARTQMVHTMLANAANWDATHRSTTTALAGGLWSAATTANLYIKKSLNAAIKQILLDTGSVVRRKDLILVLSPGGAQMLSETQEIVDHIKGSPEAYDQVKGGSGKWTEWMLPDMLYKIPIVVEDTVVTTTARGAATQTSSFVMADNVAYLMARPGGLVSKGGGPSFSTATIFAYEEMTVEKEMDKRNRLQNCDVVDDVGPGMTAPVSGYSFTGIQ